MKNKVTCIYTLSDPDTKQVRYVGRAIDPTKRFYAHLSEKSNDKKGQWIAGLRSAGKKPELTVVDNCDISEMKDVEGQWIEYFSSTVGNLVNRAYSYTGDIYRSSLISIIVGGDSAKCHLCEHLKPVVELRGYYDRPKQIWVWRCSSCIEEATEWLKANPGTGWLDAFDWV